MSRQDLRTAELFLANRHTRARPSHTAAALRHLGRGRPKDAAGAAAIDAVTAAVESGDLAGARELLIDYLHGSAPGNPAPEAPAEVAEEPTDLPETLNALNASDAIELVRSVDDRATLERWLDAETDRARPRKTVVGAITETLENWSMDE